jgi:predicted transcriptional regulator YdeE
MRPRDAIVLDRDVTVVGLQVRTRNADEADPSRARIGGLWQRFFQEGVAGRLGGRILAVYSDYESDETGAYTLTVGCEVADAAAASAGLARVTIPAGRYAVFATERGAMPGILIDGWRWIWGASPEDLGGRRRFDVDFEIYDEAGDPNDAEVRIALSLL